MSAPELTCAHCGTEFTPGVDGVSPGHVGASVDLCDRCAGVVRNPQGEAVTDPETIRRLIATLKSR